MKDWLRVTAIIFMIISTLASFADDEESITLRMFTIGVDFYLMWYVCE